MLSKIDIERLAKWSKNVSTRIIKFDQRGHWKSPSDVGDGHFWNGKIINWDSFFLYFSIKIGRKDRNLYMLCKGTTYDRFLTFQKLIAK